MRAAALRVVWRILAGSALAGACVCGVAQGTAEPPAAAGPAEAADATKAALALLDRVAKRYTDATDLHFEATEENSTESPLYTSSQTAMASVWIGPGGAFRYAGTSWAGQGMIVSDGTTEWHQKRAYREYTRAAAGTYFKSRNMIAGDDGAFYKGYNLLSNLRSLGSGLKAAHRLADETLDDNGHQVVCNVIQYGAKDSTRHVVSDYTETVWIDPATMTVLQQETRQDGPMYDGGAVPPYPVRLPSRGLTKYTVRAIGEPAAVGTFAYVPPTGWSEVAAFPGASTPRATTAGSSDDKKLHDLVGQPMPDAPVRAASGEMVSLRTLRGRPLLLDAWATWCGPCMQQLGTMDRIRQKLAATDLRLVGIDEDRDQADAVAFLKRKGYAWEDYHVTREFNLAFPASGIPLTVLVDASGKIVYAHSGDDDDAGLLAAVAALGPAYAAVNDAR